MGSKIANSVVRKNLQMMSTTKFIPPTRGSWGIFKNGIFILSVFLNIFWIAVFHHNISRLVKSESEYPIEYPPVDKTESQKDWKNWCPYENCLASPVCKPCKRRFIFIFAAGRSGSTSLMDMIDLLPNVRMSGENNGYLYHIDKMLYEWVHPEDAEMERQEQFRTKFPNSTLEEGPWKRGYMTIPTDFSCAAQKLMETINPPLKKDYFNPEFEDDDTILGFKMIHVFNGTRDVPKMVQFIKQHFPCSRAIINVNNDLHRQSDSTFYKGTSLAELNETKNRLNTVYELFGRERAYTMSLQDLEGSGGIEKMNDLARWLGFRNCFFSDTFHSHDKRKEWGWTLDDKHISVGDRCISPGKLYKD